MTATAIRLTTPPMLARSQPAVAAALCLAGCSGSSLHWPRAEPQDPAPSGPRYLRLYKESHFRALGDDFRSGVTMTQFCDRLRSARVLYLGDHHSDRGLHRRMIAKGDPMRWGSSASVARTRSPSTPSWPVMFPSTTCCRSRGHVGRRTGWRGATSTAPSTAAYCCTHVPAATVSSPWSPRHACRCTSAIRAWHG